MSNHEPGGQPDRPLLEADMPPEPFVKFREWFDLARGGDFIEPTAMTLATVDAMGRPSARVVLLKGLDEEGFVFYTNYESRKGRELAQHPYGALVFWWDRLGRQVRAEGPVEGVESSESEEYFAQRPRMSQIAAWASAQSERLPDRDTLEARFREIEAEYAGMEVPRPPYWGGYRLRPQAVEFWQNRADRMHDRLRYFLEGDRWQLERLSP